MLLSSGSSSSYPSASKLDEFVTVTKDSFGHFRTALTRLSSDESKEDVLTQSTIVDAEKEGDKTRPAPPSRPDCEPFVPPTTPRIGSPPPRSDENGLEIKANVSLNASLELPLYLSGARILNTPTQRERKSTKDSVADHDDALSESNRSVRLSLSDEKVRLSITRSTGGIGTTPKIGVSARTSGNFDEAEEEEEDTRVETESQESAARAMRLQESAAKGGTCSSCGDRPSDSGHTRFCVVCCSNFCKVCKKKKMKKLAKRAWACRRCVDRIDARDKRTELFCNRCGAPRSTRGHDRNCVLCHRHYCEVCKKAAMFKLAKKAWVCDCLRRR